MVDALSRIPEQKNIMVYDEQAVIKATCVGQTAVIEAYTSDICVLGNIAEDCKSNRDDN